MQEEVAPTVPGFAPIQQVLGAPDHALYMTSSSTLTIKHPRSDELLEMADYMGFIALQSDGDPFVKEAPDMSRPAGPLELVDEANPVFIEGTQLIPLPVTDGAMWVRHTTGYERPV